MNQDEKEKRINELINTPRMGPRSDVKSSENNINGLLDLVKHHKLEDKNVIEIGCFIGVSTEVLALHCKKLTGIDLWGLDEEYMEVQDVDWVEIEKTARDRLSKYENVTLIRSRSEDYSKKVENGSIDMIYIDGSHTFDGLTNDLNVWYDKIKIGGVIAGHDYDQRDVARAVNTFKNEKPMTNFVQFNDTSWSMIKNK